MVPFTPSVVSLSTVPKLILGSSAAGIPALQGRRFANCFRKLGRGSFFAGVGFSCLGLLSAAISLPAMSKEVRLLNVSYDATRELYTDTTTKLSDMLSFCWNQHGDSVVGYAKTEREWAERAARHLKAELKRAKLTYDDLATRM